MEVVYLACYGLTVKVEWELFPSILVNLDLDHLALFFTFEHHLDIDWCRERKDILHPSPGTQMEGCQFFFVGGKTCFLAGSTLIPQRQEE